MSHPREWQGDKDLLLRTRVEEASAAEGRLGSNTSHFPSDVSRFACLLGRDGSKDLLEVPGGAAWSRAFSF